MKKALSNYTHHTISSTQRSMSCPGVADPSTPGASHRGCAYTDEASQGLQQEICCFYFKCVRLEYGTKLYILQINEIRLSKTP